MNDYVKIYRERFWTLWTGLKKFFTVENSCTGDCNQGRNCDCDDKRLRQYCEDQRY
jgi:hypothetical protein